MRQPLAMFKRRFRGTVPRRLVYLDRDENPHAFALRYRWDGSVRPVPTPKAAQGRYVLALDPAIPFRRRFHLATKKRYGRQVMSQLSAQLFPFPGEEACYALGHFEDQPYVFALQKDELQRLTGSLHREPDAVLVAAPGPAALRRALDRWILRGPVYDLLGNPRLLHGSVLLALLLISTLAGIVVWAGGELGQRYVEQQQALGARTLALERQAKRLAQKQQVIAHMSAAHEAVTRLTASPSAPAQRVLEQLFNAIPPGVEIRSIVFKGDALRVSGWDETSLEWLESTLLDAEILKHERLPKRDYFEISLKLSP